MVGDAVIQTVIVVLLFMACFFLFLVYHLRVFVANGDFQSILTSLFVIGSGMATSFSKKQHKAIMQIKNRLI